MQTRPAMGFGYKEELLRLGGNCSKDVLPWARARKSDSFEKRNHSKHDLPCTWAIKSDSFERKESLQTRPAMGLGFKERLPRKERINPKTSCHGPGL